MKCFDGTFFSLISEAYQRKCMTPDQKRGLVAKWVSAARAEKTAVMADILTAVADVCPEDMGQAIEALKTQISEY